MTIRKARSEDIPHVSALYDEIHEAEERGLTFHKWVRGNYPVESTARTAFDAGGLFVLEEGGEVLGAAIINHNQVAGYEKGQWKHACADHHVLVIHTLVISPRASRRGYGRAFISFYEDYARSLGCDELRLDTNALNIPARAMYRALGYEEVGIVPVTFNGVAGVDLVLLEKHLS